MQRDITDFIGLDVYTDKGIKIARVEDVVIDTDDGRIKQLALTDVREEFRDPSKRGLLIPFRWISNMGEIIIIKWPINSEMHKDVAKEETDKEKVKKD